MTRKKQQGSSRRTNNSKKRVLQDFREFKNQLKRLVDKTRLVWDGEPYVDGSAYRFVLDGRLVDFIDGIIIRSGRLSELEAKRNTTEVAEKLRDTIGVHYDKKNVTDIGNDI